MTKIITHMRLDIKGILQNGTNMKGIFAENGRPLSHQEAKGILLDRLSHGELYFPVGKCDNFDVKQGCLGHETETEDAK